MSTSDALIAIPVIPLVPIIITWGLPWERWIPWGKLPKLALGPYFWYTAFAASHFRFSNWIVLIAIAIGTTLTIMGAIECATPTLLSTADKKFLKTLQVWLRNQREIMILVRYSRAAGKKSFEFYSHFDVLRQRLARLEPETSVIAFRMRQLSLRGYVDEEFIDRCLSSIAESSEFLALETDPRLATQQWLFHHDAGTSHAELRQALEELRGRQVAVGEYPSWLKDTADVISAYVPSQDGTVKAGTY